MSHLHSKKGINITHVNYRAISLTCIACNLLGHIFASSIMQHLETNNTLWITTWIKSKAIMWVSSYLTDTWIIRKQWLKHTNRSHNHGFCQSKVPHKRLLYKMKYFGISEQIVNWVESFLSNRTQAVFLENMTSSKIPVTSGVPQGTVIRPILFLIYINDLLEYIKHSKIRLFADDSIIYRQIKSQNDCLKLQEFRSRHTMGARLAHVFPPRKMQHHAHNNNENSHPLLLRHVWAHIRISKTC